LGHTCVGTHNPPLGPITASDLMVAADRGRAPLFFSSTMPCCAALRARSVCAWLQTTDVGTVENGTWGRESHKTCAQGRGQGGTKG
jgi:hypothetical protein